MHTSLPFLSLILTNLEVLTDRQHGDQTHAASEQ